MTEIAEVHMVISLGDVEPYLIVLGQAVTRECW